MGVLVMFSGGLTTMAPVDEPPLAAPARRIYLAMDDHTD